MAIFNYNSYVIYDRNGNSSNFAYTSSSEVDETGTLSDGEIGGTFEVSPADTITSSGAGPDGTFFGTTTGTSSQVYVTVAIDANTWAIYSSGSAADLVADLPNTINETNDTDQIDFTPCFLTGTLIATADGAASVESLKIGDEILSASGAPVLVRWIGRKVVSTRFGRAERLMPVRFSAGSLGCGLPYADLTVTAKGEWQVDGRTVTTDGLSKALPAPDEESPLKIAAEREIAMSDLESLLRVLEDNGYQEVILLTEPAS